jgi:sugar phosphate isomerase/epimerase
MNPELGLQLYSVRNSLQKDYAGTLEKVAETGYKYIELICNVTPKGLVFGKDLRAPELRKLLDRTGLKAVSSHFVPKADMDLQAILDDLHTLGADSLACAIAFFSSPEEVENFNKSYNKYGETCKRQGVQLYYHNHFHEFQVFGDKSIFERMIEGMDKNLVKFEFDTYWAARGGQDPIYWLKKLGSRCDLLHQKDLPAAATPANLFEKMGYDNEISMNSMGGLQLGEQFTEVGEGLLPVAGYIEASRKYNQARYIFIEQDTSKLTEFESISVSFANMKRLLANG